LPAAWQCPYLNVFKHFRVEEWKRSAREGDVIALTDTKLKGRVYRIRGSIPASSYLQLPRTGTQSLGLVGRYLYLLFRPMPRKHFVVHLDVATQENQVVRISFSTIFKEFKATATWLQFPFLFEDSAGDGTARSDLGAAAPTVTRWTCLLLDLPSILSLHLHRCYSHLKSIRLCSNLLVKNLCTSDLVFDPGTTFSEAHRAELAGHGVAPMPREMAFPVPKGKKWHDLYDFIRFPPEGSKVPYDSIRKRCPHPVAGGKVENHSPGCATSGGMPWLFQKSLTGSSCHPGGQLPENTQPVTLTKAVHDQLPLIHQTTSPKAVSAPW
ncbi:WDR90 protein, partial [Turnix velox]|nr:WDR90 protein [Turnix velox]